MKLRTRKTLAKRIKITGSGKLMRKRITGSHLKIKMGMSRKHRKARRVQIGKTFEKTLKSMMPRVK